MSKIKKCFIKNSKKDVTWLEKAKRRRIFSRNIILIAVIDESNGIGYNQKLLAHLPTDLKRFKKITENHTVLMGRKTFESIGKPLPNRRNIILSSTKKGNGIISSPSDIYEITDDNELIYVIGGSSLYKYFMPRAKCLHITRIHHRFKEVDTYFPNIDLNQWRLVRREFVDTDKYPMTFESYIIR